MSHLIEETQSSKGLRVLDPDLPMLATEAAIDIDNLLSNRSKEMTAIRKFAERLKNSIEIQQGLPHSLMDPATLTVVGEAMARAAGKSKIEELLSEAVKISEDLSIEDPMKNPDDLRRAGDFCVELSMAVSAYRKDIRALRPSHPYRK